MNRQEILRAIKMCEDAIHDGYETYSIQIARGYPATARSTLSGIHEAEKELGRLRRMLKSLPVPTYPEDGVPSTEPASLLPAPDRPWWKRFLGVP